MDLPRTYFGRIHTTRYRKPFREDPCILWATLIEVLYLLVFFSVSFWFSFVVPSRFIPVFFTSRSGFSCVSFEQHKKYTSECVSFQFLSFFDYSTLLGCLPSIKHFARNTYLAHFFLYPHCKKWVCYSNKIRDNK